MRRPLSLFLSQKLATVHDINPSPLPQRAATCYLYPAPSAKRNYTEVVRGSKSRGGESLGESTPRGLQGLRTQFLRIAAFFTRQPAEHIVITAWADFGEADRDVVAGQGSPRMTLILAKLVVSQCAFEPSPPGLSPRTSGARPQATLGL